MLEVRAGLLNKERATRAEEAANMVQTNDRSISEWTVDGWRIVERWDFWMDRARDVAQNPIGVQKPLEDR